MEYGTTQRKRIRHWKRHRVYAQKRLTIVVLLMTSVWLVAGLTATKGAAICYLLSAICFWSAIQEYKGIKKYQQALEGGTDAKENKKIHGG